MIFELIGTLMAGLAAALLVYAIRRFSPDRIPKWLIPVAAGAAMLAAAISNEYGWYGRATASLPENFVVARAIEDRAIFRPWTYIVPYRSRFIAVDQGSVRSNASAPGQRIVDLYFFGRWSPVFNVPALFDCRGNRTANLIDGAEFGPDGNVANAVWEPIPSDDPVLLAACAGT